MEKNKMTIGIISGGYFPVPAVNGGAVESIIENLLKTNEIYAKAKFTIFSCYSKKALDLSQKYCESNVIYIKIPFVIRLLDKILFAFSKYVLHKKKIISYRYIFQRLFYIRKVSKKVNFLKLDLLVFENHPTLLKILNYRDNFKIYENKYIYHIHNEITRCFGSRKYLMACPSFIGVSSFVNLRVNLFLGNDSARFFVLKNRVDESIFQKRLNEEDKAKLRAKFGISLNEKIILFCGRLSPEKGIKELLLAFNMCSSDNCCLLIAGSCFFGSGVKSKFEKELVALASPKKDKIHFTGFIEYSEIYKYYALANIVALPSIWDEPAGLTVIESIICNKCLITTYSGGIPEYVNETNAILLKRDSNLVYNLSASISNLVSNPQLINKFEEAMKGTSSSMTLASYYFDFLSLIKKQND
jgi:spore coat protein SA